MCHRFVLCCLDLPKKHSSSDNNNSDSMYMAAQAKLIRHETTNKTMNALFHSIGRPVHLRPDARDGCPTSQKWSEKALDARPFVSQRQNKSNRPRMSDSSTNQMVLRITYNVHSFLSHTRIVGKRILFDFATIFIRLTAQS